jgi:hypothetical protein
MEKIKWKESPSGFEPITYQASAELGRLATALRYLLKFKISNKITQ